jgi:hypothetical protein
MKLTSMKLTGMNPGGMTEERACLRIMLLYVAPSCIGVNG